MTLELQGSLLIDMHDFEEAKNIFAKIGGAGG
jgi:hypothetical protein